MLCLIRVQWRRFAGGNFLLLRDLESTGTEPRKGRRSGNPWQSEAEPGDEIRVGFRSPEGAQQT